MSLTCYSYGICSVVYNREWWYLGGGCGKVSVDVARACHVAKDCSNAYLTSESETLRVRAEKPKLRLPTVHHSTSKAWHERQSLSLAISLGATETVLLSGCGIRNTKADLTSLQLFRV